MPISSNGSNLKVETVIGDQTYTNEEYTKVAYPFNQQRDPVRSRSPQHPMNVKPYGRPPETGEAPQAEPSGAEEFEMPPEMERAIADDLTDKGVAPKPKRMATKSSPKRTKKTTKSTTTE